LGGAHPELVHRDDSDYIKIPFTLQYLDYFCRSVRDTLKKVAIDGFMVDWVRPTQHKNWLPCEKDHVSPVARREISRVWFSTEGRLSWSSIGTPSNGLADTSS